MKNKLNQPQFQKRIIHIDDENIITLECTHQYKIYKKEYTKDGKWLCTKCINEYLIEKNKEINEHFKSPIVKPLPPK